MDVLRKEWGHAGAKLGDPKMVAFILVAEIISVKSLIDGWIDG